MPGFHEIVRHSVVCHRFADGAPIGPGTMVFPFTLQVPDNLPESCEVKYNHESAQAAIRYELVASVTPLNDNDWAIKDKGVSTLRAVRRMTLYQPLVPAQPIDKTLTMERSVGGFLCCG